MFSISVVIPLFNHQSYIAEALSSVYAQTHPAGEVIVVDDGSSDNSLAIAEAISRSHPNTTLVTQANMGAHEALNRSIELATSEWIAVLNSDDAFKPSKLKTFVKNLELDPDIQGLAGAVQLVDAESKPVTSGATHDWLKRATVWAHEEPDLRKSLIRENFIVTTSNIIFRKNFWQSSGPFRPLRYCHDLEFFLRLSRGHHLVVELDKVAISYRTHGSNTISESLERIEGEIAAVVADHIWEVCLQPNLSPSFLGDAWASIRARGLKVQVGGKLFKRAQFSSSESYFEHLHTGTASSQRWRLWRNFATLYKIMLGYLRTL